VPRALAPGLAPELLPVSTALALVSPTRSSASKLHEGRSDMGDLVSELWAFMRERKKFWILPIMLVLVLLGGLIVATQGSMIAPFIYPFW
jgi:hypothetical protein